MTDVLHQTLAIMTPILFAALGGLFSEKAGVLNIGMEGFLITGAFFGAFAVQATGSLLIGAFASMAACALLAAVMVLVVVNGKGDVFIAGLGINLLAPAVTIFISRLAFGTSGAVRMPDGLNAGAIAVPLLDRVPVVGSILSGQTIFTYLVWIIAPLTALLLNRTSWGLRMAAAGNAPQMLSLRGIEPDRYRALSLFLSAIWCGIGGAALSFSLGAWVPGGSAGRGWIALAAVFLGFRKVWGIAAAVFLLSLAQALVNLWQGAGTVSPGLLAAFPYLAAVVGLVAYSAYRKYGARRIKD